MHDKSVRHQIANDSTPEGLKRFIEVTKHSVFGKEFQIYKNDFKIDKLGNLQLIRNKLRKLYNYREKIQVLEQMSMVRGTLKKAKFKIDIKAGNIQMRKLERQLKKL